MKAIIKNQNVTVVIKVIDNIICIIRYGDDNKAYVSYLYAFEQTEVPSQDISKKIISALERFCKKRELQLWSY